MGNFGQVLGWFDEVIGRAPHWERPYMNKSRVFIKQGNLSEAKMCLDDALKINPENEDAYYYLGMMMKLKN
ncbi:tetratricopeptide (TPR) repeat protein [Paenibacillus rhizosphaerae]|uniref:Tetratricopeptide (TPR) repeat protein n=1 Tax=Paenibacillus rhizosphaerae TaxID=297318 RepID=A0A839TS07_9BACL|nr:tetratricopeptide repeat protein [Paenibacillus rhizosphaerae]MBB3129502.1 tetratricopeptide (TPR) repeat protein [Paenibacillus rhizosphaerae]